VSPLTQDLNYCSAFGVLCNAYKTAWCFYQRINERLSLLAFLVLCFRHIIRNDNADDKDVLREVRFLFAGANVLNLIVDLACIWPVSVKITVFRSICICFHGMAWWKKYNVGSIARLRSGYIKCMKLFYGYSKYYSVTSMLLELGLASFDTLIFTSRVTLSHQCQVTQNGFIADIYRLYSV